MESVTCECTSTKSKITKVSIGGSKGHLSEQVNGFFAIAFHCFRWKMIPNCTGRYTCRDHKQVSTLTPFELIQRIQFANRNNNDNDNNNINESTKYSQFRSYEFTFPQNGKDPIIVIPFDDQSQTGLISYVKVTKHTKNNEIDIPSSYYTYSYVHTLNAPSGFQRKLQAIGIEVKVDGEIIQKKNIHT